MPPTLNPLDLVSKLNRDVERSLLRARNGVRYVRDTHAPKLGATPKDVVWKRGKAELWRYRNDAVRDCALSHIADAPSLESPA